MGEVQTGVQQQNLIRPLNRCSCAERALNSPEVKATSAWCLSYHSLGMDLVRHQKLQWGGTTFCVRFAFNH
uniref:Uncharacterized protein n=1 Tax=Oryza glumipatula TaxID=40148 RepID=A0A0D9ZJN7_9ORYZ